ncbi:MAG: response regulator [Blautia sp.]
MPKIMIVDDALFMRVSLKKILSGGGFTDLLEACDGQQACEICKEERPDLVLMDISMPNLNGIEALKKIKEIYPETAVIMCSAIGQDSMLVEAIEAGAAEFIVKPFKPEQILDAVRKAVDGE